MNYLRNGESVLFGAFALVIADFKQSTVPSSSDSGSSCGSSCGGASCGSSCGGCGGGD